MQWECKVCRDLPCRADTGTSVPPHSCLWCTDFKGYNWVQVSNQHVVRRKLRSASILSLKDIAKSSKVCPDNWGQYNVDPTVEKEAEELAREVESVVLGVQA